MNSKIKVPHPVPLRPMTPNGGKINARRIRKISSVDFMDLCFFKLSMAIAIKQTQTQMVVVLSIDDLTASFASSIQSINTNKYIHEFFLYFLVHT